MSRFVSAAAAGVLLAGGLVACTAPGTSGPVYCHGQKATMVVGAGSPRVVTGTAKADVIAVTGGIHEVRGGAGNDVMCADSLGTLLLGGDGNDVLVGTSGVDRLDGGNGNDALLGGGGADRLFGGAGTDTVSYADHDVMIKASIDGRSDSGGPNERDFIDPTVENLTGGPRMDVLTGSSARNVLAGGTGSDSLIAGSGDDVLLGQDGDDVLKGQRGDDTLDGGSGTNACDLDSADETTRACKFDMTAPVLKSFHVLTPRIDITAGQSELRLSADVTDDISGVDEITVQFCDAKGNWDALPLTTLDLASGTNTHGVWQRTVDLSSFTARGKYTVCSIAVRDIAKNLVFYVPKDAWGNRKPQPPGTYSFEVVNNQTDTTAPVIKDVVSTKSIDVTSLAATVTTEFTVIEERSGIERIAVQANHHWDNGSDPYGQRQPAEPQLISPSTVGTPGSGRYRAVMQVPAGSVAGSWQVQISARDQLLNVRDFDAPLTVVDRNPITSVPRVASFSRSAGDTAYTQTFAVHLTSVRALVNSFEAHIGGPGQQYENGYFELVSGTKLDGIWTATVQLPDTAAAGRWFVSSASIVDVLGRRIPVVNPVVSGGDWVVG